MALVEIKNEREEFLSATIAATVELLRCHDLDQAIPEMLKALGIAAGADRMQLLHMQPDAYGMRWARLFTWCAPGIAPPERLKTIVGRDVAADGFGDWAARFRRGEIVHGVVEHLHPDKRAIFEPDDVKSVVGVPIVIDGEWWGVIGFDSCQPETSWISGELDILKMLAEVVGAALQRNHTLARLADANRIIEHSTTILFRLLQTSTLNYTLGYVSSNIIRYGYTPNDLIAASDRWIDLIDSADVPHILDAINAVGSGRVATVDAEFRMVLPDGSRTWFLGQATASHDPETRISAVEGIVTDVTERKRAAMEIERLASTDSITGLANRSAFLRRLQQACAQAHQSGAAVAVHYIDLDGFKNVNDTHGHILGDELLKAVGKRIANTVRSDDTVARLGGDEFAVLQANLSSLTQSQRTAERICDVIGGQPFRIGDLSVRISASIGVDRCSGTDADGESLLAGADQALYRAKAEGRNCVRFFAGPANEPGNRTTGAFHSTTS